MNTTIRSKEFKEEEIKNRNYEKGQNKVIENILTKIKWHGNIYI